MPESPFYLFLFFGWLFYFFSPAIPMGTSMAKKMKKNSCSYQDVLKIEPVKVQSTEVNPKHLQENFNCFYHKM